MLRTVGKLNDDLLANQHAILPLAHDTAQLRVIGRPRCRFHDSQGVPKKEWTCLISLSSKCGSFDKELERVTRLDYSTHEHERAVHGSLRDSSPHHTAWVCAFSTTGKSSGSRLVGTTVVLASMARSLAVWRNSTFPHSAHLAIMRFGESLRVC